MEYPAARTAEAEEEVERRVANGLTPEERERRELENRAKFRNALHVVVIDRALTDATGAGGIKRRDSGEGIGEELDCPSYKFRPAQKSRPFRVMPDSVCDPHTILLHGVLSDFRSRAMRQLEIIAPHHQLDVLRRNQRSQSLERPKYQDFCAGRNL